MGPDIDAPFVQRLTEADSLLDAISDQASLTIFNNHWLPLVNDIQTAISAEALHTSTILTAYALSDRVSVVIQTFLDLDILSERLMSSFSLEATSILSPEKTHKPVDAQSFMFKPTYNLPPSSLPSYIQPAYRWLLNNLHNPYPSALVRDQLAKETRSARKDIDAWFIETRKRIGWNALRRQNFSNKRGEIVAAATRFFSGAPADCDLLGSTDHATNVSFMSIETQARDLYSEKFSESDLALKLNTVVKNMTFERKIQAKADEHQRRKRERNEEFERAASSYPSPNCSPSHSPAPLLPLSPSEDDLSAVTTPPQPRKRRYSSLECQSPINDYNKRPRNGTQSPDFTTGLLSPSPSVHDSLQGVNETEIATPSLSPNVPDVPSSSKRKRRLSGLEDPSPHKRPCIVSNTLPFSTTLSTTSPVETWCYQSLDLVNHELEPANTTPFEVELYDVSKFIDRNEMTNIIEYPSPQIEDLASHFLMDSRSLPFDYSELFSSDVYTRDFRLPDAVQAENSINFLYGASSSSTRNLTPNIFNLYEEQNPSVYDLDQAQIVDTAKSVYSRPSSNPDWIYPSVITLPFADSGDKFQDLLNTFPQSTDSTPVLDAHPTEFSRSMNHKPRHQTSDRDDRAAKQQKLSEIKEVARRLEAELAATPC